MLFTSIIRYLTLVLSSVCALAWAVPVAAQSAYDGFNPPSITAYPTSIAMQADGKVLIGGFTTLQSRWGQSQNIARLFPDGSHDPTFAADFSSNHDILDLAIKVDGSVLVAGRFSAGAGGGMVASLGQDGSTIFLRPGLSNGDVYAIAEESDGKILIAGAFTTVDGRPRPHIARLNADGSLDDAYAPSTGANATITQLHVQPDGKAIVAGEFTTVDGQPRPHIARLNADGSIDASFNLPAGTNGEIFGLALQPDGKILIGGSFTAAGHTTRNRIARLNIDGSIDDSFQPGSGPNADVADIALQPDGSMLIAGNFLAVGGMPRNRIARLQPDGTLDDGFPPNSAIGLEVPRTNGANRPITDLALQNDGKVVLIGPFDEVDGKPRSGIARLNADGSLDADLDALRMLTWAGGSGAGNINAVTIQPDGKFLVGGRLDHSYDVPRKGIVRFSADGSLDLGFEPGAGASYIFNGTESFDVRSIALQPDEKILVGGTFTLFDEVPSPGLVRLNGNGARDPDFAPVLYPSDGNDISRVSHIVALPDGKTLVAGAIQTEATGGHRKILRLLPDGAFDPDFVPYDFSATNPWTNVVEALALQNDGKLLLSIVAGDTEAVHLRYVIRLNAGGSLDPGFNLNLDLIANGQHGGIQRVLPQPDGKIVIVGGFVEINGEERISIARLDPDGSLDRDFNANINPGSNVTIAALQADGSLLIGGSPEYTIDGTLTGKVARLHPDGSLDRRFDFTPPDGPSSAGGAAMLAIDASGETVMAGSFSWQYPGTQCCENVARVVTSEPARQALLLGGDMTGVEWLRRGPGPEFVQTTFEWSVDGSHWATLGMGRLIPAGAGSAFAPWVVAAHAFGALSGKVDADANAGYYLASPAAQLAGFVRMIELAGVHADSGRKERARASHRATNGAPMTAGNAGTSGRVSTRQQHVDDSSAVFLAGAPADDSERPRNRFARAARYATTSGLTDFSGPSPVAGKNRGSTLTVTATGGAPQNTLVGTPFVNELVVRVTDENSLPVADVPVSFAVPGSGASAVLSSMTVSTNASGNAFVNATANDVAGGYAVTASIAPSGPGSEAVFRLANLVSNDLAITTTGGTPQSAPGGQAFGQPLAVRLTYGNGNPAAGVAVVFSRFGESSAATATLSSTQGECRNEPPGANTRCEVVTDANGEAHVFATANSQVGAYTYYAAVETPSLVFSEYHLTNTEATGASKVVISQLYRSSLATAPYSNDYIELFNAGDGPADLTGWSVQYASGSSTTWAPIDLTDITLQPGQYYLIQGAIGTATSPALPAPDVTAAVRLNNLTGRVALLRTGTPLVDANCPSNTADLVDFLRYSGGSIEACGWGTSAPTPTSVFALKRLSEGCSSNQDNSVDFTRQAPTPRNTASPVHVCEDLAIDIVAGTTQSANPNAAFAVPLTVRVTGESGVPSENVIVNFAAPDSGASATLSSATATTDSNGEASVTATANEIIGSYVVTARIEGASVGFDLTNVLPNANATVIGGSPQAVRVNRPFPTPLTVRVTADDGQPIGNVVVDFTVPGSGASAALSANAVTTDSNGEASVIATANAWTGTYAVSATIGSARADFILTNTNTVVVSQIHVSDGSFIELFNAGTEPQDLSGWSIQSAAAPLSGNWSLTSLTGIVLLPGQYYLIQGEQGDWPPLPVPDLAGATFELSTIWGRVALVDTTTPLAGVCPDDQHIIDFVGYGSSTTCFWGSLAPAPDGLSTLRRESGCSTTGNNGTDFEVSPPVRRNTVSPVYRCDQIGLSVSAIGGTPQSAPVQHAFGVPLAVRVVNSAGQPVGNVEVAFNARTTGSTAILSSTTAISNSNGEASVTASANQWAGSYPVTARLVAGATAQFDLTNTGTLHGPQVVISQIYPGSTFGSGSYYRNFVELFNAGDQPASLFGWSLQTSSGGSWGAIDLPGLSLQPGQRFLVEYGSNGGGVLPIPDVSVSTSLSRMVALVASTQPLTGACPTADPSIVDFVGHGADHCAWGTAAPSPSGLQALIRDQNSCAQSADNFADFSLGDPLPRNSASPLEACDGGMPDPIAVAIVQGAGQSTGLNREFEHPLTVRVTNADTSPMSGIAVNFLVAADGASAVLSSSSVITDSNGEASVEAIANAVVGSYIVRAMVGTAGGNIGLSNFAEITVLSTSGQQALLHSPFRELRVRVSAGENSDGGVQVLPNIPVQFSAPDTGATALLSTATVITDGNGEAKIGAVANGIAGSYQVTARIAGSAAPANVALTNLDPTGVAQPWDGWSIGDVSLPRNRNVWVRARGFTADGSVHESVKVFYPAGGFTATPVPGGHGRIEPAIPQGGDAGAVLRFTIVPDAGYGIAGVSGCDGSLNGSTYLTGPLSSDCEIVANFAGDVVTHTVTASAGSGGAIEPEGPQSVTEGETVSFMLLPETDYVIDAVGGTCGGELDDDMYTTAPIKADCTVVANFEAETAGDRLFADGFERDEATR